MNINVPCTSSDINVWTNDKQMIKAKKEDDESNVEDILIQIIQALDWAEIKVSCGEDSVRGSDRKKVVITINLNKSQRRDLN